MLMRVDLNAAVHGKLALQRIAVSTDHHVSKIISQKAVRGCVHDAKLHQAPRYACIGVMHSAVIGLGTYAAFTMRISQKVYLYHMMPQ